MLYIDQPNLQISYNQVLNCTIHTWKGYFLEEEYRRAMSHCLDLVSKTGARNLILNIQAAKYEYWVEDSWTADMWLPELMQTDLQKFAIVVNESQLPSSNYYFYPFINDSLLVIRYFAWIEEAQDWISRKGL
ncbi:hypothetical protein QNI19_10465 [Cytophagaceae bacterium DM2B3-1]|uniref:STAS/SEC14 domain-containing protein n=1 Tax=Xanthocytophaga flava TaxID=3048013 RepID=A0ABT7CHZ1_9BACT|nr:hypothetical protein [Xanthocytophaga flavus]MDJ1468457.1 hypothetical protein [Xanthocytophaga flavus]MDJ1493353.1 hypothetical protein [Xanthocytophaga flavus]